MQFPHLIDASLLSAWKSCPQLARLGYFEHFKSKSRSVHLHAGGAFAHGMEAARTAFYVNGFSAEDSIGMGLSKLLEFYGDFDCPPDSAKSAARMAGAFEFYFNNYPLDYENAPIQLPGNKRAIELSYAEPLPLLHPITGDPLLYCGRLDAILNFGGGRFITDEKTTTQLGSSWSRQWDLRSQFTGYAWLSQKAGIKVDGALVRGVSILKTKYDTQQAISYRPQWMIDQWYEEMLEYVGQMLQAYKRNRFLHNFDHSCADYGGCQFKDVCSSSPEMAKAVLDTHFERRAWDPLKRTETLTDATS